MKSRSGNVESGSEPGQVADDSTADRDDNAATICPRFQHRVPNRLELRNRLARFTRWNRDIGDANAGLIELLLHSASDRI